MERLKNISSIRKIGKWFGKHICIVAAASIVYLLSFHFKYLNVTGIYFYDGIFRLLLSTAAWAILEVALKNLLRFDYKDMCLSICTFFLVNMLWLSLCIVSLDRSLSVFLLCTIEKYGEGISRETMDAVLEDVFIEKYEMLDRRFEEQRKSGNIRYHDGSYQLTNQGECLVAIFKTVGKLYAVDERFINP